MGVLVHPMDTVSWLERPFLLTEKVKGTLILVQIQARAQGPLSRIVCRPMSLGGPQTYKEKRA